MSYPLSEEEQQKEHGAGKSHMVASSDHVPRHEPTLPAITTPSLTAQTIHPRNDPRQHAPTSNENRKPNIHSLTFEVIVEKPLTFA